MNEGLKPWGNQVYEDDDNCNELSNAEYRISVYWSDKIEIEYENDIKEYYTLMMCRVNLEKTRFSDEGIFCIKS